MTDTLSPYDALQKRLDAFTERADRIHDGDIEALHQTRVASRRLRELLPLVGLNADAARKLSRRLKKVTRELGAVRELDVSALLTRDLCQDPAYSSTALTRVAAAVGDARDAEREQLAKKLPLGKLRRLANRIEQAIKDREADRPRRNHRTGREWTWAVDARTARRAARLGAAIDAAGALYDAARLHDVRVALKKLRYAVELTMESRQRRENADAVALKDAQDLLGRVHDLEVLLTATRDVQGSQSSLNWTLSREFESLSSALETNCRTLHGRYMHDRTRLRAIAERLQHASPQRTRLVRRKVG